MQTAFLRNGLHAVVGKAQHPLGLGDPQLDQIPVDRLAELFLEHAGQVKLIDIEPFGQGVQRDLLGIVRVQIILDVLHALALPAADAPAVRVPAFFHQQRQQIEQAGADLHIPHIIVRPGKRIQFLQQRPVALGLCCAEGGLPAALLILFIDTAHIRAIEMRPAQPPQIVPRAVQVRPATIQKDTVPRLQRALRPVVFQDPGTALHKKDEVGCQPLPDAGVGLAGLQAADLLQMQQIGARKG